MTSWKNNNLLYSMREADNRKVVAKDKYHLKELIEEAIKTKGPNCDLNYIDVSQITDMSDLFHFSNFTGDISKWNVSNVKNMRGMFYYSLFNGDISNWDVSNVHEISYMFKNSEFTGDISKWNPIQVTTMLKMF